MKLVDSYKQFVKLNGSWQDKLSGLADALQADFACERVTLFFKHTDGRFVSVVAQGLAGMTIDVKPGEGLAGKCIMLCQTLISNQPEYDHRSLCRVRDHYTGFTTRSILAVPMLSLFGSPIGIVQLINKLQGDFTQADADNLQAVAKVIRSLYKDIPQPISNIWQPK